MDRYRFLPRRHVAFTFLLALILILVGGKAAPAQPAPSGYPKPANDYVNDFAQVLEPRDRDAIQTEFKRLEYQTGIEAVVVTIDTVGAYGTGDTTIESFATHLFNVWGIGHKKTNDGVLFLVAVRDRKARIEVGKGYGRQLDARMKQVLEEVAVPRFRDGDISGGIRLGSSAIIKEVTVPVTWFQFHKWHLLMGGGILALVLSGLFLEGRGRRGLVWFCFGGAFWLLWLLCTGLIFGKSEDGFGGGSSDGGGASADW